MSTFLLAFLSIYSAMHALVFFKVRILLPERWPYQLLLAGFMAAMIFAPIGTRLLEKHGHDLAAQFLAYLGYTWLGFIFLAFCGFALTSAADFVLHGMRWLFKAPSFTLNGPLTAGTVLVLTVAICLYGYLEARNIRIERVSVETAKLPAGIDRLKIAQISDVHLGLLVSPQRLHTMVAKIASEEPDILVCTGDLVDGNIAHMDTVNGLLKQIHPPLGKYAVTGNHEFYAGLDRSLAFIRSCGFRVLRGEAVEVRNVITIVGVDDPGHGRRPNELPVLTRAASDRFTLFLKHRPEVLVKSEDFFDLQLSGHTHRGQIFPFSLLTGLVYPMQDGLYTLRNGTKLYTSRGSGTWGPPIRFLSPPEVSIIELVRTSTGSTRQSLAGRQ